MEEIRMFIVDSWKGPSRQDGAAMWMVERMKNGEPDTREGFVHLEKDTQARAVLMAMTNAACILNFLKKPFRIRIYTECTHVSNAVLNGWHLQWQENGWRNARGEQVKNADVWELFLKKAETHEYTVETGWHPYLSVMQGDVARELKEWKKKKRAEEGVQMTLEGIV